LKFSEMFSLFSGILDCFVMPRSMQYQLTIIVI